jgi:hypothetical protein
MTPGQLATQAFLKTIQTDITAAIARHQAVEGRSLDVVALVAWLGTDLPSVIASLAKLFVIITT